MNLALIINILDALGMLARNPLFQHKQDELAETLAIGGFALNQYAMADEDRKVLLEQIREANNTGRGKLTAEQAEAWRNRHAGAKKAIDDYFANRDTPKSSPLSIG